MPKVKVTDTAELRTAQVKGLAPGTLFREAPSSETVAMVLNGCLNSSYRFINRKQEEETGRCILAIVIWSPCSSSRLGDVLVYNGEEKVILVNPGTIVTIEV